MGKDQINVINDKKIIVSSIKAIGDNRVIKPDENGAYRVALGAVNVFNSAGEYYVSDGLKALMDDSKGGLKAKLKKGYLKGENGHPKMTPGMNMQAYIARNLRIEETLVSHHIKEIELIGTSNNSGCCSENIIEIYGLVTPSGPYGDALKKDLDNPDINVAFSIRSFTANGYRNGIIMKDIKNVITWDWVTMPGIATANKWDTLGIESMDLLTLGLSDLADANNNMLECLACSLEDSSVKDTIKELIGYLQPSNNKIQQLSRW